MHNYQGHFPVFAAGGHSASECLFFRSLGGKYSAGQQAPAADAETDRSAGCISRTGGPYGKIPEAGVPEQYPISENKRIQQYKAKFAA